jgi:GNAT superfamily N-acetyltransferase
VEPDPLSDLMPVVVPAVADDIPDLLEMMRELAAFEEYLQDFAVTEPELHRRGFSRSGMPPEYFAWIAREESGTAIGYAVAYLVPFTYDLKPALVLKELYVRKENRRRGSGKNLLNAVETFARAHGSGLIRWAVLPGNKRAERFYRSWGGEADTQWNYWRKIM